MSINIKIGEYDVLASGSVIGIPGEDFVFEVYGKKITFTLKKDPAEPGSVWRALNLDEKHYELTNFDSSIGKENESINIVDEALEVDIAGRLATVKLMLLFRIYPSARVETGIFHYTWLTKIVV